MRTLFSTLLCCVLALLLPKTPAQASTAVSTEEAKTELVKKVAAHQDVFKADIKKELRAAKKMAKAQKQMGKEDGSSVDFSDPVQKWFWFWIFGWGVAILFSILAGAAGIGGLWWIGYLAGIFGTVSLIIWLIKKFGGM